MKNNQYFRFLLMWLFLLIVITSKTQGQKTEMVYVHGGEFMSLEKFSISYTIPNLWVDKHEVTVSDFAKFTTSTGYVTKAEKQDSTRVCDKTMKPGIYWKHNAEGIPYKKNDYEFYPVVYITYEEACAFCEWKNKRLPTEIEYEYLMRNGNDSYKMSYPGSDDYLEVAWCIENSHSKIHPIMTKKPNELGLYDLSGNVYEMCQTRFDEERPSSGFVAKGGGFLSFNEQLKYHKRLHVPPKGYIYFVGFRCVQDEK